MVEVLLRQMNLWTFYTTSIRRTLIRCAVDEYDPSFRNNPAMRAKASQLFANFEWSKLAIFLGWFLLDIT
jgi:hypothetical protein